MLYLLQSVYYKPDRCSAVYLGTDPSKTEKNCVRLVIGSGDEDFREISTGWAEIETYVKDGLPDTGPAAIGEFFGVVDIKRLKPKQRQGILDALKWGQQAMPGKVNRGKMTITFTGQ